MHSTYRTSSNVDPHGRAKPPPKSCINAWVVVLFYNNFIKKKKKIKKENLKLCRMLANKFAISENAT